MEKNKNIFLIGFIACFPIVPFLKKKFTNSHPVVYSAGTICATLFALLLLFVDTAVLVKTFSSNNPFLYWNF